MFGDDESSVWRLEYRMVETSNLQRCQDLINGLKATRPIVASRKDDGGVRWCDAIRALPSLRGRMTSARTLNSGGVADELLYRLSKTQFTLNSVKCSKGVGS